VGLTEHSDALALVVSETYGQVSMARGGKLLRNLSRLQMRQTLKDIMEPAEGKRGTWFERLARLFGAQ
jgi:diadenylate cyclase